MSRRWAFEVGAAAVLAFVGAVTLASPVSGQDPRDAWMSLLAEGDVEGGREALVTYAGGLPPVEATKILRWVESISRTEGEDQQSVAQAIVQAQRGDPAGASTRLTERVATRNDDPAAVLLALAVRMSTAAGDVEGANELRQRLVDDFEGHPATPEMLLELAEYRLEHGLELDATAQAVEDLIVDQPTHPLVPTARRLLTQLRDAGRAPNGFEV